MVGPRLITRGRLARPRGEAVVPDSARRARPLHRRRPPPGARGRLAAVPGARGGIRPVDAVNGAFMLMRRSALEEVGRFDEGYWMYMEDLDLSYRLAPGGWITWYEPSATVARTSRAAATGGERRSGSTGHSTGDASASTASTTPPSGSSVRSTLVVYLGIVRQVRHGGGSVRPAANPRTAAPTPAQRQGASDGWLGKHPFRRIGLSRRIRPKARHPPLNPTEVAVDHVPAPPETASSLATIPGSRRGADHTPLRSR